MGMLQSIQAGTVRYGGCPVRSEVAHAIGRGETLLYGCITWTLGKEHFAELRTAHHRFLLRVIGFQRRQRTDYLMSYAKALKKAQCESVGTTIRKRRLLFAGAVQRTHNERLTRRVMFGTMVGAESGTRPTRKELGPLSSRRLQGVSSHRGIDVKRPLGVGCRNGAMAHGGYEGWEGVSGSRRSGGMFHDEVAHGRGGRQLTTPHNRGSQE